MPPKEKSKVVQSHFAELEENLSEAEKGGAADGARLFSFATHDSHGPRPIPF
jgi:hypothetical protein